MARWRKTLGRPLQQRGSILVTVLAVLAVLLTIFLSAMAYSLSRFSTHKMRQNRLVAANLSEAGIARTLDCSSRNDVFGCVDSILSPNGGSIVTDVLPWGPYLLVTSKGIFANQEVITAALMGSTEHPYCSAVITVGDENFPLTVAGDCKIIGDVNTGALGITAGKIKGRGVGDEDFHIGENQILQDIAIPALDSTILAGYYDGVQTRRANVEGTIPGSKLLTRADPDLFGENRSVFIENNLVIDGFSMTRVPEIRSIFVDGSVEIKGASKLSALVEIVAGGSIYVNDSAVLDNTLLYAQDSIILSGHATFSGLAMAHREISVRDNARLKYPSVTLLAANDPGDDATGGIYLASSGRMESVCYLFLANADIDPTAYKLLVDSSCFFTGVLISQGMADIQGYIYGTVLAEQYRFNLPPTTYVNWIRDLYINRDYLRYSPALPVLKSTASQLGYAILRRDRVN